jgi:hypothetical protein
MTPEEAKEAAATVQDGIYFHMPMEVYREVRRCSASAIQRILISPGTWWRDSWLNPNPPVLTPTQLKNREKARLLGSAYHCARLEPEQFELRYVRGLAEDDMPEGTLFTGKDMGAKLKEMELPVSGSVNEQAQRLQAAGFPVEKLWYIQLATWEGQRGEREPIEAVHWDEIVVDMRRIRAVPEVAEHLEDGEPEVSIFWTCPKSGLPMKSRLDFLKAEEWTDFKSYSNPNGKDVGQAIVDAFTYNRYFIQAAVHLEAVEAIRTGLVEIQGEPTAYQAKLIAAIRQRQDELACWYVFQEKDGIPNLFAYEVELFEVPVGVKAHHPVTDDEERIATVERTARRKSMFHSKARVMIRRAKELFQGYADTFPEGEPWRPIQPVRKITDMSFRQQWLESGV